MTPLSRWYEAWDRARGRDARSAILADLDADVRALLDVPALCTAKQLAKRVGEAVEIEDWLFDASRQAVGDLVETSTLLLESMARPASVDVADALRSAKDVDDLVRLLCRLPTLERLAVAKLATGAVRLVSAPEPADKQPSDERELDAVLVYATKEGARRAGRYTELSLALWSGDALVPVARVAHGLPEEAADRLDKWIRRYATERRGPVAVVPAEQVFRIAFRGSRPSARHKAGVVLEGVRVVAWNEGADPKRAAALAEVAT